MSKLSKLRALLEKNSGYIIPITDEYQGEYTADQAKRLEYITGFSGSNGLSIIFKNEALFFTDGRYTQQAKTEVNKEFSLHDIMQIQNFDFNKYPKKLFYNPKLFTPTQLNNFPYFDFTPMEEDLVDKIWDNRPQAKINPFWEYPLEYAGKSSKDKFADIVKIMESKSADYLLITKSDSICWLLNIRGNDVDFNPVTHGYIILTKEKIHFFTNIEKAKNLNIETFPEEDIEKFILSIPKKKKVMYDSSSMSEYFVGLFDKAQMIHVKHDDPVTLPKAIKNDVEIEHAKKGHIKDGRALSKFFKWLEKNASNETEYSISVKLEEFRAQEENFITPSFPTIAGFKENGAIIHYRPHPEKSKTLQSEGMLLIDSGAQYLGCTTDVTRTICFGKPTKEQIKNYTLVLKGHIALMLINFPIGTSGSQIDALARQYLWKYGLNYAHGTGHGVGSCLNVHEGPQRIAPMNRYSQPLLEGMIISNEPGYYKNGEYGIRIENLVYVTKSKYNGFLKFENLTMVEYCNKLIDFDMLNEDEKEYLDKYHKQVQSIL